MEPRLTPTEELLISLCRLEFTESQKEHISQLVSLVSNWKSTINLINDHGIPAMLWYNLDNLGLTDLIPQKQIEVLRQSYLISLTRNTYLLDKFAEAMGYLERAGISPVLMKGLPLELTVYGNNGIRQMNDIDVLIERKSCLKARELMLGKGFRSAPVKSPLYNLILPWIGKHLPELYKDDLSLEIHHNLFNWDIDLNTWYRSESSSILIHNIKLLIPSPKLHFLYLIKHLDYHESNGESQLRLYTDLFLMAEKYGRDLVNDELYLLARKARIEYVLYAKLALLKEFWGLNFIDVKNPGNWNKVVREFKIFLSTPKGHPVKNKSAGYRKTVRQVPGLHRKIIYVIGDIFPSISFMMNRYNLKKWYWTILYYPHRLGKLYYLIKRK